MQMMRIMSMAMTMAMTAAPMIPLMTVTKVLGSSSECVFGCGGRV